MKISVSESPVCFSHGFERIKSPANFMEFSYVEVMI